MTEYDDKFRKLLNDYSSIQLEIDLRDKNLRIKRLRDRQDQERREVEHMEEKRKKAEEIFAITREFLQCETFFDLLDFFKNRKENPRMESGYISFRERMERFGSKYADNDTCLVIWSKQDEPRSKILSVAADGSVVYEITSNGRRDWRYRRFRNSSRRRFYTPADMAAGLKLTRLDEIYSTLTLTSIIELIEWQLTDEVHTARGQLVKGTEDLSPIEDGIDNEETSYDASEDAFDEESDD